MVRPDGIHSLAPSSVKKKLKDKGFAAKVSRDDVYQGAERLGANLDEHIQLVIDALKPHADALGIAGGSKSKVGVGSRKHDGFGCRDCSDSWSAQTITLLHRIRITLMNIRRISTLASASRP